MLFSKQTPNVEDRLRDADAGVDQLNGSDGFGSRHSERWTPLRVGRMKRVYTTFGGGKLHVDIAATEAALIVGELDYLALAVTLAGAYVAATPRVRSNIAEYLPEYRRRRRVLLGRKANAQIHRYSESVLSTWETSCAAIATRCPVAVRLLSFFAFLAPEDIFLELFQRDDPTATGQHEHPRDEWRDLLSPDQLLEEVLDEALEALSTYSLIEWKEEQGGYSMHKLVHAWGFDRLDEEEQGRYSQSSLSLLAQLLQAQQLDPVWKSRITHLEIIPLLAIT
ncbi:hypothetical protein LTR85_001790 [Meristemomyces frigidus]|nr:hypothetical protein LTR85_001790 [Meristemomyces frigidus]